MSPRQRARLEAAGFHIESYNSLPELDASCERQLVALGGVGVPLELARRVMSAHAADRGLVPHDVERLLADVVAAAAGADDRFAVLRGLAPELARHVAARAVLGVLQEALGIEPLKRLTATPLSEIEP